ncbi:hypothetical protein SDC9_171750 [bioreactor metagenome]|uniref:Uncharacterized protein n=1 Tax=bioreactor metagenome TaxID=1076179 RepID=A0A645GEB1_9ZZZZ
MYGVLQRSSHGTRVTEIPINSVDEHCVPRGRHAEADSGVRIDDAESPFANKGILPGEGLFGHAGDSLHVGGGKQRRQRLLEGRKKVNGTAPEGVENVEFPIALEQKGRPVGVHPAFLS